MNPDDFAETLESMSQLFGAGAEGENQERMLKMLRFAKSLGQPAENWHEGEAGLGANGEDAGASGLSALKFALPFLDARCQKTMAVWIKLRETQNLLENFSRQAASRFGGQDGARREMLWAVRPYVPEERQREIDLLIKTMEFKELTELLARIFPNG